MYSLIKRPYLKIFLFPLALCYWALIFFRNLCYNIGVFASHPLPCKIISIGNITTGGTGKTPAVIYFAKLFKESGLRVAVLSRGYGRVSKGTIDLTRKNINKHTWKYFGEEPLLIAKKLINVPVVVDNNRYRGGLYLLNKYESEIILLDDGFQHRSLYRDIDITLINANQPSYNYKLLPYGLLREPWKFLKRSDFVILTKRNIKGPSNYIRKKLKSLKIDYYNSKSEPSKNILDINGVYTSIKNMKNKKALAISAIGDPLSFEIMLKTLNIDFIDHITYKDHYEYKERDFNFIYNKINKLKPDYIITTEKDLIKFNDADKSIINMLYALPIQFSLSKVCLEIILKKLELGNAPSKHHPNES